MQVALAQRLAKLTGEAVTLSSNLPADDTFLQEVAVKRVAQEVQKMKDKKECSTDVRDGVASLAL